MKLSAPFITTSGDEVRVSAAVEVSTARSEFPDELWFCFPRKYEKFVTDRLDGFAVSLLPLAQFLGEDLHVDGALSPRLLNGMMEYQRFQCAWQPSPFKPVHIECQQLAPATENPPPSNVVSSFSGGIDSFNTLWQHLPENEPIDSLHVTHGLMINGFDADTRLEGESRFSDLQRVLAPKLLRYGIELINCRSNFMAFSDPRLLKQTFGAMVVAPALVLGHGFSTFFVPSSFRFDAFVRDGSHLLFDHLISTESMQTVHDSGHLKRPQRTAIVADWDVSYHALRVCSNATAFNEQTQSIENCCRCEKCVRTLKTLECLDRLDRYATFPRRAGHLAVWKCYYGNKSGRVLAREVMTLAWRKGRYMTSVDFGIAITLSMVIMWPRKILQSGHLAMEEHFAWYARSVRKLFPRLRRRAYWIR